MSHKNKINTICDDIDALEPTSRLKVLEHLISTLKTHLSKTARTKTRKLSELKGVGREIWKTMDVESYLKKERSEWGA